MDDNNKASQKVTAAQWRLVGLVVSCAAGALAYRLLMHRGYGHTSAMFVGVPAVLAILVALTPGARTVTGGIVKGITLALLIVTPLVGEGYVCILFASPIFYLVGIVIGGAADYFRRRRAATLSCFVLLLIPVCLEGVVPELTFPRAQSVSVTTVVNAPIALVEATLARSPRTAAPLPAPLQIGFPRPLAAWGEGLTPGALRTIHFSGAEGDPPGDLVLRLSERRPGYARFDALSDDSKLTQWLEWKSSEIEWRRLDEGHTSVTWRIVYNRRLDPAWYFVPIERWAVREAARYLIAANAAPPAVL